MKKTVLITGSTDGIGLETARMLVLQGHTVLLHGRNADKLKTVEDELRALPGAGKVHGHVADLSHLPDVERLAKAVAHHHDALDVLINNAGVLGPGGSSFEDGLDVRFVVNTIAPYMLTLRLLPLIGVDGRVVNVSSAAQSPVDLPALRGQARLADMDAYAQSKLALTMWSAHMAARREDAGPVVVSVNPGSLLGTKMVKDGFGVAGSDIRIGADILVRAALSDEFTDASGKYFDNDSGNFASPHPDALDPAKCDEVVGVIERILADKASA
ncbi:SDR family NAD(P)-dependent oxidoreductase [Hoeflea prorocentri]|uniref:SDR family NAD(P)-dependent oxidoreductase n=1 Tax=Hoeflea prorocentri TaxID=1922333 RepID=A0A9X3ULV9_9HYPH|nr:SDR family NAD(P)-dependent oxidoreductase [Hoeflea prorocentri]MCY6383230.1 SDR family NAD(P)-dependent oxidoreductase [Hoeflea prorocentri]MDA5401030.1 SDR family NAD(P)-dependent oxidoreductase [Hoeflea prorocentri]